MNRPSILRRISALEMSAALTSTAECLPLTTSELDELARRIQHGEALSTVELARLERQSPIVHGELLTTCHGGQVNMKRYIGIDLALL